MLQSTIRRIRLTAVAVVLIGSSVASSVASATTESPPADPPIVEPAPDERDVPTTTASVVESPSEPAPLEPVSDFPVPPDESTMIGPDGAGPSSDYPVVVEVSDDPVPDVTDQDAGTQLSQPSDPHSDVPSPSELEVAEPGKPGEPGGDGDDHDESEEDGDHQGCGGEGGDHSGCGGEGNPYRMTFAVLWYTSSGDQILQLTPEWRNWFKLEAAGQTGSGKATAARCTYPASSNDLTCEFQNPGHGSIVDGMVVPGKPTATYTVSVSGGPGDSNQWSISNANGGPYSARALCPRGDDGGHDDGGHSAESLGGDEAWYCMHTIEMQQLIDGPATVDPPAVAVDPGEIAPPTVDSPTTVAPVSAVPVVQDTLPATGSSMLMILVIGALMVAVGAMLVAQTRRGRIDGFP